MQKKSQAEISKKNKWLDLLVFVLFANVFFFHSFGTVALALFLSGLWVLVSRVFGKLEWKKTMVLAPVVATLFFVDSPEKIIILVLVSLAIMLVSTYTWLKQGEIGGILEMGLSGLIVVREYLASQWQIMRAAVSGNLRKLLQLDQAPRERSPWVRSIAIGLLTGLPIVAWLVSTLTKADPVFSQFVKEMFSEKFLTEMPARFIISAILLLLLIPMLMMKARPYVSPVGWLSRMKWGREMTVVTIMVALVLGTFLVVQWPYVFVDVVRETDLAKYGVATYSEYVQKGFADLLKVVVMVFGVAWIGLLINKNQKGKERDILLWIQGILGVEFVIFVVSIFRRVWLYQSYHGLSLARLYGLALLVGIVGMTVTMALRYFYQNVRWVKVEVAWILLIVFGSILMNMEAQIVKNPPTVNGRVDYVYLARLSSDGKEGWVQAYTWAKQTLDKNTANTNQIGRDDRRDIFYAGLITRELVRNYHNLILQYGSDDEVKDYENKVIDNYEEIVRLKPIDGSSSDRLVKLRQRREDLKGDKWVEKVNIIPTHVDFGYYKNSSLRNNSYFYVEEGLEEERLVGLDYLLGFDPSKYNLYIWMRGWVGYEKLLEMQKMDLMLQHRISGQPSNEQDFDIDISLDSPFLR